jgi:4-hydroxy-3-methylbut-2-enyl diphosphate reductase
MTNVLPTRTRQPQRVGTRRRQPTKAASRLVVLTPLGIEAAAVRRGAPDSLVLVTGMGPRRVGAWRDLHTPALAGAGGAVAVMGFGGAVQDWLQPGDLVVATEVRSPGGAVTPLPSAPLVAGALRRAGLEVHLGPITSRRHLVRGGERRRLAGTGALGVDMESAWLVPGLAEAGESRGGAGITSEPGPAGGLAPRPVAVVRAIVDTPSTGLWSPAALEGGVKAYRSLVKAAGALRPWAQASASNGEARQVLLAGPRSFCAGVERAIEIVERALERYGPPVYVRRQIVHNRHVVASLEGRGAIFVEELEEVPEGATVVFSAHGVSPSVRHQAGAKELHVIDATCPLVAKVHAETRRFSRKGYQIVLVGHAGHEEVEGTMGEAPGVIHLVEGPEDVASLDLDNPSQVAYLTQTTLATDEVAGVVERLRDRFPTLVGPAADDICYATQNRQEAVRSLAGACDVLIVVGSANSSNSNRLVEVAGRLGCPAHLIDDAEGLDPTWLVGAKTVGVTAGASAPESMVQGVVSALASLGPIEVSEHQVTTESVQFPLPTEVR